MTYTCSWCLLDARSRAESTHPGDPPAYDEDTGDPICCEHAAEQDGIIDAIVDTTPQEEL